jgi:transcriptional regulator with XRE-family HTH domain
MKVSATPQSMRRIIGGAIRAVRNGKDLKQEDLAKLTGVGARTIANIERPICERSIRIENYDKLCSYLGIEFTIRGGAIKE